MDGSVSKNFWDIQRCSHRESFLGLCRSKKPYTLFTDASKYAWAAVLTQEHTTIIDDEL